MDKKILGPTPPDSPIGKELVGLMNSAEQALAEADSVELFELFKRAIKERGDALNIVGVLSSHYLGDKSVPRYSPSDNAVESMERVALAALDLAKATISRGGTELAKR